MLVSTAVLIFVPMGAESFADMACGLGLLVGLIVAFVLFFTDISSVRLRTFFEAKQTEPALSHSDLRLKLYLTTGLLGFIIGTMFILTAGLSLTPVSCLAMTGLGFIVLGFLDLSIFFRIRRDLDK